MREAVFRGWRHLKARWYLRRASKGFFVGFLPLLFLLASCGGGGGGGGSGGGQGILSVDLAFTPGDGRVTVELVEKGPLVQLLNISTYQLTAIDSTDEAMTVEGPIVGEEMFNGSTLRGLTNDRNYTFALRVFYFPVGSTELSDLSLRVDYAEEANARNERDAGGITIGINTDGDYLADLVDADDDNDGLNDLNDNGMMLDDCPRGELNWRSNEMTDNDGDGCRDEGEDLDDDNDNVTDSEDLGEYNGRECRLFADCDNDTVLDGEDLGEFNGEPCRAKPDCDDDTIVDLEDNCPAIANSDQADADGDGAGNSCDLDDDNDGVNDLDDDGMMLDECPRGEQGWRSNATTDNDGDGCRDETEDDDDDNDMVADTEDLGDYNGRQCRLFADCDGDSTQDGVDIDDDGDGLIEIRMAAELDAVRWVLNGSGRQLSEMAALDQTGCGNGTTSSDITECAGYELMRDISLAAYADGEGWAPLGRDTDSGTVGFQGTAFSGTFDGNGFAVRELNISRSGEDYIGLFGHVAAGTVIRNLKVMADSVIGRSVIGVLMGSGVEVEILSSSSVAGSVRGVKDFIGGLVGLGTRAEIMSSYSVAGEVMGFTHSGGLMGWGESAEIVSSYSVVGKVGVLSLYSAGLMGGGGGSKIVSSYSVAGEVSGSVGDIGGLLGNGVGIKVVSSWSVAGEVIGPSQVGGLAGRGGDIDASYWYTAVSVAGGNDAGEEKTLAELRTPTNDNAYDASSIYANWTRGADIDDMAGVEDITRWCDEDISGAIEMAEMRDGSMAGENDNRIWDFGGSDDYPAIRCLPLSLMEQRSWWFINSTGHPNVNRTRLDALTSP